MTDEPRRPPFAYDMQRRTDGHVVWWESADQRWVVVSADYWNASLGGGDDLLTEEVTDLGSFAPSVTEEVTNPMARDAGRREVFNAASIVPADGPPVAPPSIDDDFAYRSSNQIHLGTAALMVVAVALLAVGFGIWYGGQQATPYIPAAGVISTEAAPPPRPKPAVEAPSAPGDDVSDDGSAKTAPSASDAPNDDAPATAPPSAAEPAEAAPAKKPAAPAEPPTAEAPAPRTKAATNTTSETAAERGWGLVESLPAQAAQAFREAIEANPNNLDAVYGLGYALLRLDQPQRAAPHLCSALRSSDIETQREASSMLSRHNLSCD